MTDEFQMSVNVTFDSPSDVEIEFHREARAVSRLVKVISC